MFPILLLFGLASAHALEPTYQESQQSRSLLMSGASCSYGGKQGSCLDNTRADCNGGGWYSGLCAGGSNIKCCVQPCRSGGQSGQCMPTNKCYNGQVLSGLCDGPSNVKCCMPSTGGGSSGSCSPVTSASKTSFQAYSHGTNIGTIQAVKYLNTGKYVEVNTGCEYYKMSHAASGSGINLVLNSGFRTMADQTYFYNCYINKNCNNGNLAARPGYSNHQNGKALDISTGGGAYNWLVKNAYSFDFIRTVCSERWHWEYRPGTARNAFCSY